MYGPMEFIHSGNYLLIPGSPYAPRIRDPPAPILLNALKLGKPAPRSPELYQPLPGAIDPQGTMSLIPRSDQERA